MAGQEVAPQGKWQRVGLFALFLLGGLAIFLLGVPYHHVFPTNGSLTYATGLALFFLAATLVCARRSGLKPYRPAVYAFFIAAWANWLLVLNPFRFLIIPGDSIQNLATDKLAQFSAIVPAILILTKLAGEDFGAIFLQRGRWKLALIFGLASFALFAALAFWQNGLFAREASFLEIFRTSWPWLLLFILANSLMEELWFRGIFLRKFQPFFGGGGAVLLTALVFGISHLPVTYVTSAEAAIFGVIVFALGLIGAAVMIKTDSVWGAVLFHAGYDLMIIVPVVAAVV